MKHGGSSHSKQKEETIMATERKVWEIIKSAGFEPVADRGIIVKYAPENLSDKIAQFFSMEFYVLQLCKDEMVLVPFSTLTAALKKEVTLQIPYSAVKTVEVREDMLNYQIAITTDTDTIRLTAQQKELSDFRAAGALTFYSEGLKMSSWHKENLDATLEALKTLNQQIMLFSFCKDMVKFYVYQKKWYRYKADKLVGKSQFVGLSFWNIEKGTQ